MSRYNYRGRRRVQRRRIILAIIIVLLLVGICSAIGSKIISKVNVGESVAKENKVEVQQKEEEQVKEEPKIDPKAYKKGTSHNNEATAWAYSTKDVRQWIQKPSSYTGTDKVVFLTFDDGPSEVYTNTVLDTLKNYGVHASFFIVGRAADKEHAKEILQREMAEGHSVGLHSYTHEYSFLYPKRYANMNNIISEVDQNIAAIKKSLGDEYTPTTLRYPGGHMSWKGLAEVDAVLEKRGIQNIDWNMLSGDAEAKGSKRDLQPALDIIKEDMQMYGNPKVVVLLMHDIKKKSVDALPSIIEYYQSMGYKFGILD
ncbi:MAG: polysaccharide deacetylase family protein [Peptostreptococcaceae bacterium]|jgi:polysaccharide deacetylase|nr:polysaccharide deacetylase family protein [Peptostreptococcaceae bacterium]